MFFSKVLAASAAFTVLAAAKEIAPDEQRSRELFQSGARMEEIRHHKEATWAKQRANGMMNAAQYQEIVGPVACVNGIAEAVPGNANYTFQCSNIDLLHFLSHTDLGSETGEGSSSWGWTSPEGREFVAVAQADGAAFVEINKEGKMLYVGRLPKSTEAEPMIWREIRGYKNFMVIGSEAEKHGIQIFDMTKLVDVDPASPVVFNPDDDVTGFYNELPVGRTHNVVVNEETDYVYAVGAVPREEGCRAGLIFIDVKDPANPVNTGCAGEDGYVHDAQCMIYRGPDEKFAGKEVCYGYNEDTLTIYDVTDKKAPTIISRTSYEGAAYAHQGWILDPQNQEFLILDDEYDEVDKVGPAADGHAVTYIWDIRSLEAPKQTGLYKSKIVSNDHNQYIKDGKAYQSNYGAGFRILDISSIPTDPTGAGVKELGFFDVYPEDDNLAQDQITDHFVGSWSSYALFSSGHIFVNTIERGAYVLKESSSPNNVTMKYRLLN